MFCGKWSFCSFQSWTTCVPAGEWLRSAVRVQIQSVSSRGEGRVEANKRRKFVDSFAMITPRSNRSKSYSVFTNKSSLRKKRGFKHGWKAKEKAEKIRASENSTFTKCWVLVTCKIDLTFGESWKKVPIVQMVKSERLKQQYVDPTSELLRQLDLQPENKKKVQQAVWRARRNQGVKRGKTCFSDFCLCVCVCVVQQ